MTEIWKQIDWIPNLRGSYEVSNLGNIRRTSLFWRNPYTGELTERFKTRSIKAHDNGHGYLYVVFVLDSDKGRKLTTFYVHRLVAQAFVANPDNKPEVNHKNFVRSDNQAVNLEWVSSLENMKHSSTMDRRLKIHYPQPKRNKNKKGCDTRGKP